MNINGSTKSFCSQKKLEIIQKHWGQKGYYHIPSLVFKEVNRYSKLSSDAKRCWLILNHMVTFEETWSIVISRQELGNDLDKSPCSVDRYVKNLADEGFLIVEARQDIKGNRLPSRYHVTLPDWLMQKLIDTPDRAVAQSRQAVNLPICTTETRVISEPRQGMGRIEESNNNILLNKNNNNSCRDNFEQEDEGDEKTQKLRQDIQKLDERLPKLLEHEKKCQEIYESICQEAFEISKDKTPSKKTGRHLYKIKDKAKSEEAGMYMYKTYGPAQSDVLETTERLEHLKKLLNKPAVTTDYLNQSGARAFSDFDKTRLRKSVERIIGNPKKQARLIEEIAYAARFGSLAKAYNGQGENHVSHAVNIGLKLVREGRWQTPKRVA